MTVAAVDAIVAHVVRVAELQRLLDELLRASDVGATTQSDHEANQADGQEEPADNTGFRESIGARLKDLWHRMLTNGARAIGRIA